MAVRERRALKPFPNILTTEAEVVDGPHVRELDNLDVRVAPVLCHGRIAGLHRTQRHITRAGRPKGRASLNKK